MLVYAIAYNRNFCPDGQTFVSLVLCNVTIETVTKQQTFHGTCAQ